MEGMHNNIVEGEPGIFPDPIARLLVRLGRLGRRKAPEPTSPPPAGDHGGVIDDAGEGREPRDA